MIPPVREHADDRGLNDSRHPGETHRTAPTTAPASGAAPASRLLGPEASCAEELLPLAGVELARDLSFVCVSCGGNDDGHMRNVGKVDWASCRGVLCGACCIAIDRFRTCGNTLIDFTDCPCNSCEGARMSFGHYQTGA